MWLIFYNNVIGIDESWLIVIEFWIVSKWFCLIVVCLYCLWGYIINLCKIVNFFFF